MDPRNFSSHSSTHSSSQLPYLLQNVSFTPLKPFVNGNNESSDDSAANNYLQYSLQPNSSSSTGNSWPTQPEQFTSFPPYPPHSREGPALTQPRQREQQIIPPAPPPPVTRDTDVSQSMSDGWTITGDTGEQFMTWDMQLDWVSDCATGHSVVDDGDLDDDLCPIDDQVILDHR